MNKYLTERFKKEGFYSPKFEFVEDVKYYPTEAEQRAYDSAMKTYDSEYSRWLANEPSSSREVIAGEIVVRSNPYKKPTQPTLSRSLAEYHYYVKISGSLKPKFVKTMTAGQKRRYVSDLISGAIFLLTCFLIYWFLIR